jgi:hypothetical protein
MEEHIMTLRVKNLNGMLHYYQDGVEITAAEARTLVAATPDGVVAVNEKALLDKIATALANNAAFLAIASPTNANIFTQTKSLTRQVNALLKLVGRDLTDTAGT